MDDPRQVPLYSIPECARYLGLPVSTVRRWIISHGAALTDDDRRLVKPAGSNPTALSFTNLVELHVFALLRRTWRVSSREIRAKIDGLNRNGQTKHPLASREFLAYSRDQRVELGEDGLPSRYFPYTRGYGEKDPKLIVIDPLVSFGRPVIKGSGVRTSAVARFTKGGETIAELADDYALLPEQIEEAVRYERAA